MKTKALISLLALAFIGSFLSAAHAADANMRPLLTTCSACHGAKGISVNPLWPNLAGQKEDYLRTQLLAFRDGKRSDPLMSTSAKNLSDEQIEALAAHYSKLPLPRSNANEANNANNASKNAATLEPTSRPLVFCVRCHGGDGVSANDIWPSLAGQKQAYLEKQMKAYFSGVRKDDMMAIWGKMVDEQQLAEILGYFSRQGRP